MTKSPNLAIKSIFTISQLYDSNELVEANIQQNYHSLRGEAASKNKIPASLARDSNPHSTQYSIILKRTFDL